MGSVTVEPVIFCYVFTNTMLSPLLQQYIYDEVSREHNFTKAEDNILCANGSNSADHVTALEKHVETEASYWFIVLGVSGEHVLSILRQKWVR